MAIENFDFADRESLIEEIVRLRAEVDRLEGELYEYLGSDYMLDDEVFLGPPKPLPPTVQEVLREAGFDGAAKYLTFTYMPSFVKGQEESFGPAADFLQEYEAKHDRNFAYEVGLLLRAVRIGKMTVRRAGEPIDDGAALTWAAGQGQQG